MSKPASIQSILEVRHHDNADSLDIVKVMGYECITKKDQFKVGEKIIFIEPDSVLPDAPWATFYKSKSSRVKAIKLRQRWSFGVVESIENVGYTGPIEYGLDISAAIGVTHYEPPAPQEQNTRRLLPYSIPKTNEERWQSLKDIPFGEVCDVTLKIDGQSFSFYYKFDEKENDFGVCGRTIEYQLTGDNNFTKNVSQFEILQKLGAYCRETKQSICLRGEQYGLKIQGFKHNPHTGIPLSLALYSTYLIDEGRYARKGDPYYIFDFAPKLGLPTVPVLEKNIILTPELIKKYDEQLETINGKPFEGVVIQWRGGSFKVINKNYDSKK